MNYDELARMAEAAGFTAWAPLDISTLAVRQEVRDMCAANTCGLYDKVWSCPPGCGTPEECAARLKQYSGGILVQTTGEIEDSFDFEGIMEAEAEHREHFTKMYAELREKGVDVLALGAGGCRQCNTCTYPDAPCRFPDRMVSSMEANGLVVLEVCKANGLKYFYGSETMTYTGCFLL